MSASASSSNDSNKSGRKNFHPLTSPAFIQRVILYACNTFRRPVELQYVSGDFAETVASFDTTFLIWNRILHPPPPPAVVRGQKRVAAVAPRSSAAPSPFGGIAMRSAASGGGGGTGNSKFPDIAGHLFLFGAMHNMTYIVKHLMDLGFDPSKTRVIVDKNGNFPSKRKQVPAQLQQQQSAALPAIQLGVESHPCGTIALDRAVSAGHLAMFHLLTSGENNNKFKVSVNSTGLGGRVPVHYAAQRGDMDVMKALLRAEHNAALLRDKDGQTALHHAAQRDFPAILKLLVTGVTTPFLTSSGSKQQQQQQQQAGGHLQHPDPAAILLDFAKPSVNDKRYDQDAALHIACQRGHFNSVDMLLALGADPNLPGNNKNTPLHYVAQLNVKAAANPRAAAKNLFKIVRALARAGAAINQTNEMGRSCLHIATLEKNKAAVDALLTFCPLLQIQDRDGNTPAHLCATDPDLLCVLFTYDRDAAMERLPSDDRNEIALHAAFQTVNDDDASPRDDRNHSDGTDSEDEEPLPPPYEDDDGDVADGSGRVFCDSSPLRDGGWQPRLQQQQQQEQCVSPFSTAYAGCFATSAASIFPTTVQQEQQHSPSAASSPANSQQDSPTTETMTTTPGRAASFSPSSSPPPSVALIKNNQRQSVMTVAARGGSARAVQMLIDFDVRPSTEDGAAGAHSRDVLGVMVRRGGLDVNMQNHAGESALHLACAGNSLESVKHLLSFGANPKLADAVGNSPLHVVGDCDQMVRALVLRADGTPTSMLNRLGQSALFCQAEKGHTKSCIELLRMRARTDYVDSMSNTALHMAVSNSHAEIVRALLASKADRYIRNHRAQDAVAVSARIAFSFDATEAQKHIYFLLTGEHVRSNTITPAGLVHKPIFGIDY